MANTQTTVPLFVANQVLTAAQQNASAGTGVPVFATTVTRDAAFGGSNKALAEGQLCYIEASNIVQYYDGAAWATVGPSGTKIGQVVQGTSVTAVNSTSTSYVTTGLAVTITPTLNTSNILVMCSTSGKNTTGAQDVMYTLFRGTVAGTNLGDATNGFASLYPTVYGAVAFNYLDAPATTSATTYTMGMRIASAGPTVGAQQNNGRGTIIAMEVLV